jgi:tryptophanyl-tRNA synthetase
MRQRRAQVLARPEYLDEVLFEGSRRARVHAGETMTRVREAMKIAYR